jgi:hypothetical protein
LRFKALKLEYKLILFSLISTFLTDVFNIYHHKPATNHLVYAISLSVHFVLTFSFLLLFMNNRKFKRNILYFTLLTVSVFFIELVCRDINKNWMSLGLILFQSFLLILCIKILSQVIIHEKSLTIKRVKFLIIIPLLVSFIYTTPIFIMMFFFYSKEKQLFFISLYQVNLIIDFLTYISYSLAFIWAPRKEQYLSHTLA